MIRYAIIRGARTAREVLVYLPGNYRAIWQEQDSTFGHKRIDGSVPTDSAPHLVFVIEGRDVAGWTLDGYVQPRYASGLMGCEEIDLSHPIMNRIPA